MTNSLWFSFYFKHLENKNIISNINVVVYPVEIVVYIGAVVTSLLLIATLNTFALARYCDNVHAVLFQLANTHLVSVRTYVYIVADSFP